MGTREANKDQIVQAPHGGSYYREKSIRNNVRIALTITRSGNIRKSAYKRFAIEGATRIPVMCSALGARVLTYLAHIVLFVFVHSYKDYSSGDKTLLHKQ